MEENLEITKVHARSFMKIAFRTLRNFFDYPYSMKFTY